MRAVPDQIFIFCLLCGFGLSLLMVLSAGTLGAFGLARRLIRVGSAVPRAIQRLRLPGVAGPKLSYSTVARAAVAASGSPGVSARREPALFPPGAFPVLTWLYITFFGAIGLVCRDNFSLSTETSLFVAGSVALVPTLASAFALWRYFLGGAEEAELSAQRLIGKVGHVSVTIPESGTGAIAYTAEAKRVTMPARSRYPLELAKATSVVVVDLDGFVAVVEEA